ncbi:agamous-like MADS-box protein AGL66 [Ziziphus jujuba]|uniref:Agamous-like MADS-box protein AGL66 n=1 Tax=Ziziphus jujuba TaxID=326968 RepID=A0ABM4A800_ZIZJJ|nr:agamous-like MADS-box protein AGL66 [Ziziphus jujuba]
MGRQKRLMMKIDNPCSRHTTYSKRRDGILKKASELSVLCDADVGLLMFSPSGRLTSFSSNGRIEDVFLRYVDQPNELRGGPVSNEDYFYQRLRELKHEGEMLEKLSKYDFLSP